MSSSQVLLLMDPRYPDANPGIAGLMASIVDECAEQGVHCTVFERRKHKFTDYKLILFFSCEEGEFWKLLTLHHGRLCLVPSLSPQLPTGLEALQRTAMKAMRGIRRGVGLPASDNDALGYWNSPWRILLPSEDDQRRVAALYGVPQDRLMLMPPVGGQWAASLRRLLVAAG